MRVPTEHQKTDVWLAFRDLREINAHLTVAVEGEVAWSRRIPTVEAGPGKRREMSRDDDARSPETQGNPDPLGEQVGMEIRPTLVGSKVLRAA